MTSEEDTDDLFHLIFATEEKKEKRSSKKRQEEEEETDNRQLRLPSSYNNIVDRIEDKYKRRSREDNYLVDITSLSVEGTTAGQSDSTDDEVSDVEYFSSHEEYEELLGDTPRLTMPSMPSYSGSKEALVRKSSGHYPVTSSPMVRYSAPKYRASSNYALVTHEPPMSSMVFNLEYQEKCLQKLYDILSKQESLEIRSELEQLILQVLGGKTIPSPECPSVYPFITFDDEGGMHITFLFDAPPNTFWQSFFRNAFGSRYLRLQRDVYALSRERIGSRNIFAPNNNLILTQTDLVRTIEPETDSSFVGDDTFDRLMLKEKKRMSREKEIKAITNGNKENRRTSTENKRPSVKSASAPAFVSEEDDIDECVAGVEDYLSSDEDDDSVSQEFLRSTPIIKRVSFGETSSRTLPPIKASKRKLSDQLKEAAEPLVNPRVKKLRGRKSDPARLPSTSVITSTPGPKTLPQTVPKRKRGRKTVSVPAEVTSTESTSKDKQQSASEERNEEQSSTTEAVCPIEGCASSFTRKYSVKRHLVDVHKLEDNELSPYSHIWYSKRTRVSSSEDQSPEKSPEKVPDIRSMADTPLETVSKKRKKTSIVVDIESSLIKPTPESARLFGVKEMVRGEETAEVTPRRSSRPKVTKKKDSFIVTP